MRPPTVPSPSNNVLVSLSIYDDAGRLATTVDPAGMMTDIEYDDAGRRTKVIENVQSGSSSSSASSDPCPPSADTNRTTTFTYTADGAQATVTAWNPETGNQTTTYTYGTTLTDSEVASSLLLRTTTYPDSAGGWDAVTLTYNRQGETTTRTDQRGCVHTYGYDGLGRQVHDRVTTLGTNVDGAVRRILTIYDVRGLRESLTSYDDPAENSGNIVNQVQFSYDGFSQPAITWQAHGGAVNTVTSPRFERLYENGSSNTARLAQVIYPNGRELDSLYGTSGEIDDRASRLASLVDEDTTSLAAYEYLGLSAVVRQTSIEPEIAYTLINLANDNDPDTGDLYSGLDRFGRLKDVRWRQTTLGSDLSRVEYGYDRVGNRTWRRNPSDSGHHYDWIYRYDGLHRLKDATRGTLNGGRTAVSSPQAAQCWSLDELGNWPHFRASTNGSTWTLEQSRSANAANEITSLTNQTGSSWTAPAYDPAGNLTTLPQPAAPGSGFVATYDAWNRLVKLTSGGQTVQVNEYDGRNYRTVRKDYTAGILDETRHFYYTDDWRVVEERVGTSTAPNRQFVWGVRGLDDLILRDRSTTGTLNERLYALQDANGNVTAVADTAGVVQERYEYTPYGETSVLTPAFGSRGMSSYGWETTFAGYRWDAYSGLFPVRNRFYHALLGVWASRDPIAANRSLYIYVRSRPLVLADPLGLYDIFPAQPGSVPQPGGMLWQLGGRTFELSPAMTAEWNQITGRGAVGEFFNYWNPWGSDIADFNARINRQATWWNTGLDLNTNPNLSPMEIDRLRQAANNAQMYGDLDRATRALDLLSAMSPCLGPAKAGAGRYGRHLLRSGRGPHALPPRVYTNPSKYGVNPNTVLSGHGIELKYGPGEMAPSGTSLTVWGPPGGGLADTIGQAIETGTPFDPRDLIHLYGSATYLPGAEMPPLYLGRPVGLDLLGSPKLASDPTRIGKLLQPNMGNVEWAACRKFGLPSDLK